MARINAGKYRHIATFQRLKDVRNSYGEKAVNLPENWEDAFTLRVGIFPISGREALTEQVKMGEITHRVVLRFFKGIDNTMRIKFGGRIFEIVTPPMNSQERNDEIFLLCKELDPKPTGVL